MGFSKLSCEEFVQELSSRQPVPGGGGACALVGALATALGNMVGSLTVGKKKYAAVEEEILSCKARCDELQERFLQLIDQDAAVFEPLSRAYSLPKGTEEEKKTKAEVMEAALLEACQVPLLIMEACTEALSLIKVFAEKGSVLALSDAGVAAAFCRAALEGASLNVSINTRSMQDRLVAGDLEDRCERILEESLPLANQIYEEVRKRLKT